jgi:hypothetical protein
MIGFPAPVMIALGHSKFTHWYSIISFVPVPHEMNFQFKFLGSQEDRHKLKGGGGHSSIG